MLKERWGQVDFIVRTVWHMPCGRSWQDAFWTPREGFKIAMETSVYTLSRRCAIWSRSLAPKASVLTLTYLGSERVVRY